MSSFPVPKVTPFLFIANMQPDVSLGQPHFPANTTLGVRAMLTRVALQNRLICSGSDSHRLQRCVYYLVIVKQNCTLAIISVSVVTTGGHPGREFASLAVQHSHAHASTLDGPILQTCYCREQGWSEERESKSGVDLSVL